MSLSKTQRRVLEHLKRGGYLVTLDTPPWRAQFNDVASGRSREAGSRTMAMLHREGYITYELWRRGNFKWQITEAGKALLEEAKP